MIDLKGKIGKYQILKKLGSGGFGTVYLVEDTFLKSYRAIKVPHRVGSETKKLLQECVVQTKLLDHPNIVKLLTVDIIQGNILMVMEYIQGTDLEKVIDQNNKLSIPVALKYFKQILSAVAFAGKHKIIHRDIRPSNIMITKDDLVKITDFGTSTLLENRQFATTKIGSPPYMAPEQFEGKAVLASDIYSSGCLFYEMVTGFPPIVLANPMEIYKRAVAGNFLILKKKNPQITDILNRIIMKMLAVKVNNRYKSAENVLSDLNQMENKGQDNTLEVERIKKRLDARYKRDDFICWNCRKTMPNRTSVCLYCGAEQQ